MSNLEKYSKLNEKHQQEVNDIILRHTMYSAGTGFIPIPIVDAAALLGVQMYMVRDISEAYELEFKEQRAKFFINALIGGVAAVGLLKFIPGLGTIFGGASVAIIGSASTYALGKVFVKHFEEGGTFLDFDPVKSEAYFKKQVKEGQKVVKNLRRKKPSFSSKNKNALPKDKKTKTGLSAINNQSKHLSQEISALHKEIETLRKQRNQDKAVPVLKEKEAAKILLKEEKINSLDLNDLQIIKGIGVKTAKTLINAGIQNIQGLSETTPEILHDILEKAEGRFILATPDTWILQAQLAIGGNEEAFRKFQEQLSKKNNHLKSI